MHKHMQIVLMAAGLLMLTGCVLAPQTIQLNEVTEINGRVVEAREALVRVIDERGMTDKNQIGHRGGRAAAKSPLLSEAPLNQALTARLQNSLTQLGFGESEGWLEPIKMQLDIHAFQYQCNENVIVNECSIELHFVVTVIDESRSFNKPYRIREMRQLAASPVAEYNEKWVNEALDKIWHYMFSDPELLQALGAN